MKKGKCYSGKQITPKVFNNKNNWAGDLSFENELCGIQKKLQKFS